MGAGLSDLSPLYHLFHCLSSCLPRPCPQEFPLAPSQGLQPFCLLADTGSVPCHESGCGVEGPRSGVLPSSPGRSSTGRGRGWGGGGALSVGDGGGAGRGDVSGRGRDNRVEGKRRVFAVAPGGGAHPSRQGLGAGVGLGGGSLQRARLVAGQGALQAPLRGGRLGRGRSGVNGRDGGCRSSLPRLPRGTQPGSGVRAPG